MIYRRAREIFVQMISDGADLKDATAAREKYVRDHFWCKACDEVKHREMFYFTYGTLIVFPCKECKAKSQRAYWARKKLETSSRR